MMELKVEKIEKIISENMVRDYANVSGDFNPIHLDYEYAKNTEFKNKIVHGMLLISNINEIMFKNFNQHWNKNGSLKIKFRSPLFVNSKLITPLIRSFLNLLKELKLLLVGLVSMLLWWENFC